MTKLIRSIDRIIAWPLWKLAHFVEWIGRRLRKPTNPGWFPAGSLALYSADGTEFYSGPVETDGSTIRSVHPIPRTGTVVDCRWTTPDGEIRPFKVDCCSAIPRLAEHQTTSDNGRHEVAL